MCRKRNRKLQKLSPLYKMVDKLQGVFGCAEVLWPSQPNGVMSSAVSLPNPSLLGRLSPLSG